MIYALHLFIPKTGQLTTAMVDWLFEHGQDPTQPELFWPVRKLRPKALALFLLKLDPTLIAVRGAGEDVELHYPHSDLGILLYLHERGIIIYFPYSAYGIYSRIVLGICYTYIRYLYDQFGFWSYDPQFNLISYADDFQSLEDIAALMDALVPKQLSG